MKFKSCRLSTVDRDTKLTHSVGGIKKKEAREEKKAENVLRDVLSLGGAGCVWCV